MKELEIFHFGEKSFHKNDSKGKVAAHLAIFKVNLEYTDHVDKYKEVYWNSCNMSTLNKQLRRNTTMSGGKRSSSSNTEQKG